MHAFCHIDTYVNEQTSTLWQIVAWTTFTWTCHTVYVLNKIDIMLCSFWFERPHSTLKSALKCMDGESYWQQYPVLPILDRPCSQVHCCAITSWECHEENKKMNFCHVIPKLTLSIHFTYLGTSTCRYTVKIAFKRSIIPWGQLQVQSHNCILCQKQEDSAHPSMTQPTS